MIIDVIRGVLKSIATTANNTYQTFVAFGRPDETISGRLMQHYGFTSIPPEGTELITLQYGNNCYSVAENTGIPETVEPPVSPGSVRVHIPTSLNGNNIITIALTPASQSPSGYGVIEIVSKNGQIIVQAEKEIQIGTADGSGDVTVISKNSVFLGDANGVHTNLVNANFVNNMFINHTHSYVNGTTPSTTGVPIAVPQTEPVVTTITKAN